MDSGLIKQVIEGALLAAGQPVSVDRLLQLFDGDVIDRKVVKNALQEIAESCDDRGFELVQVASGFRFQVKKSVGPWVIKLWNEKAPRYSRALLETLSLIAYRQPITRAEIEDVRGVSVSSNIIKTLLEREWVRVVGHRDVPGRPALFATTKGFLDYFELRRLDDLPTLAEIRDLDKINKELDLAEKNAQADDSEDQEVDGEVAATEQTDDNTRQITTESDGELEAAELTIDFSDVDQVLRDFDANFKKPSNADSAQVDGLDSPLEQVGADAQNTTVSEASQQDAEAGGSEQTATKTEISSTDVSTQ